MAVITRIIATLTALVNLLLGSLGIIGTPAQTKTRNSE